MAATQGVMLYVWTVIAVDVGFEGAMRHGYTRTLEARTRQGPRDAPPKHFDTDSVMTAELCPEYSSVLFLFERSARMRNALLEISSRLNDLFVISMWRFCGEKKP